MANPAIELRDVDLSLGEGAARVHILRKVSLTIDQGEAVGLVGAVRLRQIDAADDHGGPRAARQRLDRHRRRRHPSDGRGRAGALSRRADRHRLPVLSSHPDDDRARKRRRAARARGRAATPSLAPRRNWRWSGSPNGQATIPPSSRAASSSASRWRGRLAPRPSLLIADEPTGNLDEATGRAIIDLLFDAPSRSGATLALVTHDPALAARCDRTLRMRSGVLEALAPALA